MIFFCEEYSFQTKNPRPKPGIKIAGDHRTNNLSRYFVQVSTQRMFFFLSVNRIIKKQRVQAIHTAKTTVDT